jgi:hypothetical protein
VPTFVLITTEGTTLGAWELEEDEAEDDAVIEREGHPPRRVLGRIDSDDAELFDVLVVERVDS